MLERIDAIEALGIAPPPPVARVLAHARNAVTARLCRCRDYTAERHAAWLAGGRCHDHAFPSSGPAPGPHRSRLRARIVLAACRRFGLAALAWAAASCAAAAPGPQPVRQRGGRLVSHRTSTGGTSLPRPLSGRTASSWCRCCRQAAMRAASARLPADGVTVLLKRGCAVAPQHVCIVGGIVRIDGVPRGRRCLPADRLADRAAIEPLLSLPSQNRANCSC